ncbi:MAG TPA: [protein-PII] uridylyltransferase [Nocardioidaceae bacterium]|nr:[protein-PII] uridylyltransferase [Nocardioidaceae bacterium]
MTEADRQVRGDAADAMCAAAFSRVAADPNDTGTALVAVGGYGRRELAPYSDLDLVLVHDDHVDVAAMASEIWYPLWDAGAAIDHSVRALSEVTTAAKRDLRVALGLLDARHLAGDPSLTLRLRASVLAQWRRDARQRLPELRELVSTRGERLGELAHAAVPDLKESTGGLRDATALKALVATWLVDVPHTELERCRMRLLDVRDALHEVSGRSTDRVAPDAWADLAGELGLDGAGTAQRQVRETGRRITHLSRLTWSRVEAVLARPTAGTGPRRPALESVAAGVAVASGEVVLDRGAEPNTDPALLLRAPTEAAERGLILAPATAARLTRECPTIPEPWNGEARSLLTRLLAAGPGLLPVWETLEETGGLHRFLPEWDRVRLLPHASEVHRFTVDRHMVETCIEASRLVRRVARPDVLMVAALLHDIGKGGARDHSLVGEQVAACVASRMGFDARESDLVSRLVRWHLLLAEVATTRDLDDPATIILVAQRLRSDEMLDLLEALTEADACATSAKAWTPWRAGLVGELVSRVRAELSGSRSAFDASSPWPSTGDGHDAEAEIPATVREDSEQIDIEVSVGIGSSRVTVTSWDRVGLMAAVAATFAVRRISVRSVRAWTQESYAFSVWEVDASDLDPAVLRQQLRQQLPEILEGRLGPISRLRRRDDSRLEPAVAIQPDASQRATVLEVRVDDWPGVIFLVCSTLASLGISVRSAHVTTFGPQAVDVFYVQELGAGALTDERAAAAAHAVRRALADPVTLDA